MNIADKFNIPLKPLAPKLLESKTFDGGNRVVQVYLKGLEPKKRNRILNYGIGVEIEVEMCPGHKINGWEVAIDGSLRNAGHEYKTIYGTRVHGAWNSLQKLEAVFKNDRAADNKLHDFTERCSVHVHIDCRTLTIEQLNSFILLYILAENPFFNYAGPRRQHNIFCVPILQSIIGKPDVTFKTLIHDPTKYSALNIKALQNFGTLEFRHMEGTDNAERIFTWIMLISALMYYAETVSNDEIKEDICKLKCESQYDLFIQKVFGKLSAYIMIDQGILDGAVSDAKLCFHKGSL